MDTGSYGPQPQQTYISYDPVGVASAGVVLVHGGGWVGGVDTSPADTWIAEQLAAAGIQVWLIDYSLIDPPTVTWPAPLSDVQTAISWAFGQVTDIPVGVLGTSAGGHLVYEAGLGAILPAFVIGISGPSDIVALYNDPVPPDFDLKPYIDKLCAGTTAQALSPALDIASTMPPTLVIQGSYDTIVPQAQAIELWDALGAARKASDQMLIYPGGHVLGQLRLPQKEQIMQMTVSWITNL